MKLTLESAKALQPGGRIVDHNLATKGLELRARGAVKSWHLYYVLNGKERRPKIGEFPAISIDEARRIAGELKKRIARGEDPSAERQAMRHAPTVADLIKHYLENYAAKEYKASTLEHVRTLMSLYVVPELGAIRVAALSVSDVNGLLDRIAAGAVVIYDRSHRKERKCAPSKVNANRVCAYLSKALALAEGDSLRWRPRNTNPCQDTETRKFHEAKRRVHIATPEFAGLHTSLEELSSIYPEHVAAILCALFAGTRITEMAVLRRDAIETDLATCAVYAVLADHKTVKKTGEHRVLLPRPALEVMGALPLYYNGYVFGGLAELKSPRRAIWGVWKLARERAGIRDEIQARDLRRTFASVAKSAGASLDAIGELLRHGDADTTMRYAFLFADKAQELAENTAGEMQRLMIEGKK